MPRGKDIPGFDRLRPDAQSYVERSMSDAEFGRGFLTAKVETLFMEIAERDRTAQACKAERKKTESDIQTDLDALKATRWMLIGAIGVLAIAIPILVEIAFRLAKGD